jgi:hypothetical protein
MTPEQLVQAVNKAQAEHNYDECVKSVFGKEIARFTDGADQIPLGLNACCVFFINGQNLVIGIVKTGA